MCNANSTEIPEWVNDYQPTDKVELKLLSYYRQLFKFNLDSKEYKRAFDNIYTILVNKGLLNSLVREVHTERIDIDNDTAIEKNFNWLNKPLIVITPKIISLLERYCKNHPQEGCQKDIQERIKALNTHLNILRQEDCNSTKYRRSSNYLSGDLEKHIEELEKKNDNHPFLREIKPLIKYWRRIQYFSPYILPEGVRPEPGFYLQKGLYLWIQTNLKRRQKDLYYPNRQPKNETLNTELATHSIKLKDLDDESFYEPRTKERVIRNLLEDYLKEDPHGYLASRHIRGYPECTYKILVDRLILKEPPDSKTDITDEFGVDYQKFASAELPRKFYPTIASIAIEIGCHSVALKQTIIDDTNGELRNCKRLVGGELVYDAQVLAHKLLPVFQKPESIFSEVVNYLNKQGHQLRTSTIFMSNEISSFEIFLIIAEELKEQGYNATSCDVLEYWKTVKIEEFSQELQKRKYKRSPQQVSKIISPPAIRYFWEKKCWKYLGKLAIDLNKNKEGK